MNARNNNRRLGRLVGRKGAVTIAATAFIVLLLSLSSVAGVAWFGAVALTPGSNGGAAAFGLESAPITAPELIAPRTDSGSVEIVAAGKWAAHCVLCYSGELCCGPAKLAP
jgi:hypothetical protein